MEDGVMRIEVSTRGCSVPEVLRLYAEERVWRAARRMTARLSWIAVRLKHEDRHEVDTRVVCRIDAWLRGVGVVSVTYSNIDTYVAIDRAAVLLEQALRRTISTTRAEGAVPSPNMKTASEASWASDVDTEQELCAHVRTD
jgi:ribosomal subunit interface protein